VSIIHSISTTDNWNIYSFYLTFWNWNS
jgi:hypothetical protein